MKRFVALILVVALLLAVRSSTPATNSEFNPDLPELDIPQSIDWDNYSIPQIPQIPDIPQLEEQNLYLVITSVTSPVRHGYNATLTAKTLPNAYCTITVYYKSGPSEAQGLYSKIADSSGNVFWTWKVGTRTTPGSWKIVVTASLSGKTVSQITYFTVT